MTWQFETEYRGNDFTAAVTVANPDVLRESGDERLEHQMKCYDVSSYLYKDINQCNWEIMLSCIGFSFLKSRLYYLPLY